MRSVPQKNAFIVDEDRELALMVAAALRSDGLKVSISEGDRDPLDEIRAERPDIVLVRAESSGKESGYTLCARVKRNKRTTTTPVFLYTSKDTEQMIETHRSKDTRADEYLIIPSAPPYPLEELRDRVRNVLFPPGGLQSPPPLPPVPKEDVKPVTQEDTAFIEKVMDSLSTSSDEPPPNIPLKRDSSVVGRRVTTADAKLDMLREKLRQREVELARVMEMYRAKEREYHQFNERLVEKDVEAQSLKMTIDELVSQLNEVREELERRTNEFNSSFELLLEEKVNRENELIQVVAGKEKDIADLKGDLYNAERTAKTRIEALEESLNDTDQRREKAELDIVSLKGVIGERERAIQGLEHDLEDAAARETALGGVRDQQMTKILAHEERMLRLEDVILELRSDLSTLREENDASTLESAEEIAARDAIIEGLRGDFASAEATFASTEASLRTDVASLGSRLETRDSELSAEQAARRGVEEERDSLSSRLTKTSAELDEERIARAASEDSLNQDLQAAELRFEALTAENERIRRDGDRLENELRGIIASKEEAIASLDTALKDLRADFANTEAKLKGEIERLESARISVEQALADREDELMGLIRDAERTIAARDSDLAALRSDIASAQEDIRNHLDRIASLEAELAEEGARFRTLEADSRAEKDRLGVEIRRYDSELASARAEAESLEAELRDQIMQLGIDLASKGDEIDTLRVDLGNEKRDRAAADKLGAQLGENLRALGAEHQETLKNLRGTERELSSTRETLALREGRIAELVEALKDEKEDRIEREQQLKALRADYDSRAAELGRAQGRIAVLDDNLTSLRVEQEELESALEETRQELTNHRSLLATARAEANERAQRLEETSRTLARREQEITEYREQLAMQINEKERVIKERDLVRAEKDRANDEIGRLTSRSVELANELDEANERGSELEAEVESRGGRIEVLTQNLSRTEEARQQVDKARVQLTTDLARAEEALARLQSELERARVEWNESRTGLIKERDAVRSRMAELGTQLDAVRDERDQALHSRALLEEQSNARRSMDAAAQATLEKTLEGLRAQNVAREEEVRAELEARDSHARTLDREVQSTREELESQRALYERATRDIESLQRALDELSAESEQNESQFGKDKSAFEQKIAGLEATLTAARNEAAAFKTRMQSENQTLQQSNEGLEKERERLRADAAALGERLEEATRRAASLAQEKSALEERRAGEVSARDGDIASLRKQLEERRVENVKASQDFTHRLSEMQSKIGGLETSLEDAKQERDDLETKYLKEFEEAQENFLRTAKDKEAAHHREVEELRAQKIELTRQLKTSQLAAQRLTDRVQKLETERPLPRTGAEQEFDSFLKQLEDSAGSKLPVPSSVPGPAGASTGLPARKPLGAASPVAKPGAVDGLKKPVTGTMPPLPPPSTSSPAVSASPPPASIAGNGGVTSKPTVPPATPAVAPAVPAVVKPPVKAESISAMDATVPAQALTDAMEEEVTTNNFDLGTAATAGSSPKPMPPAKSRVPPARRPLPKLDPKAAGQKPTGAAPLAEDLGGEEDGGDFMSNFDRNFDSIKKS